MSFDSISDGLARLGWTPFFQQQLSTLTNDEPIADGAMVGRIAADHGSQYTIFAGDAVRHAVLAGRLRRDDAQQLPCVGDWVLMEPVADRFRIIHVFERVNAFVRKQLLGSSRGQAIAANVDVAIVVVALTDDSATRHVLHRTLNPRRIERYLVALSELHIRAVVAINKADLNSHAIHHRDTLRDDLGRADVLLVSAHSGVGLDELASRIAPGETAVVVGSSGVGKSSVINRLLGSEIQSTYAVRNADARGRHTTVHRELFVLPSDGLIIDTPGMRQFALVGADGADADSQSHATGFEDFDDYAKLCRFRDCQHQGEPGCAVIAALETGELDAERLFHAQKLQRELARQRQRHDALAQRKARKARAALIQQMREVHERKGGGGRDE